MKRLALHFVQRCGIFAFSRVATARMARILTYHNFCADDEPHAESVSVSMLRDHLEYLRRNFRVVPLAQILEQLRNARQLDSRSVALTVDDGRRNCYEFLFPLLKEFQIPATFFVVSCFIQGEDWIWTDKLLWLRDHVHRPAELARDKIGDLFRQLNRLRPEIRDKRIEDLAVRMGVLIPKEAPAPYTPCSWSELQEMANSGLVEIGSHTVTHPILSSITDEESWRELTLSRAQIEEHIGKTVSLFCFPNGTPDDYRPSQVRQVQDAGYQGAVVTRFGMAAHGDDLYQLPRMGVGRRFDPLLFAKRLAGADYYQVKLQSSLGWKES